MKSSEFLRLIQEIGVLLNLSSPTISHVIEIYKKFVKSSVRQYKQEIVITACFYLVGKIVEEQKRIRDILVAISVVTRLYKLANQNRRTRLQEEGKEDSDNDPTKYLSLVEFEQERHEFFDKLVPNMNNEQYLDWKKEVLEAEQHLLRIINYDLKNETLENYQLLLNYIKIFNLEYPQRQMAFDIYQDTYFVDFDENISSTDCVKGAIFLAIQFHRLHCADKNQLPRLKVEYCVPQWWEEFMQIPYKQLLQFELEMQQYYKENEEMQ